VLTINGTGAPGTGTFKYQVGSEPLSATTTIPTGLSFPVPGTYSTISFANASYTSGDTYTVATTNVVTHAGGGTERTTTSAASPLDWYNPKVLITTGGALGTAQFKYSLDGTDANMSAAIVTPAGGVYAIPNSGIVVTFGGSMTVDDYFTFTTAGPAATSGNLTSAMSALETTYLSSTYSMGAIIGNLVSSSDWVTQCSTLETAATALFNAGVYVRFLNGAPTTGTITGSSGSVAVNTTSTDSDLETARLSVSAPHVSASAGDCLITSPITGLSQRRNASWVVAARASAIEASQNPGAVLLGAVKGVTYLYRNEQATPGLDAVGFDTLRTYPGSIASGTGLAGFFITDAHTMSATTSDYYPFTNARVIDLGCTIAKATALQYVQSKIPTTTRNGLVGVITEEKAQIIERVMNSALLTGLVNTEPQDAVAAATQVNRTHNILSDGNLIITIAIQPFAYARTVTVNIGLAVVA